jgi:hypothetical protein
MPNLGDVITSDDILVKGTGKYSAKYVNWARVAHLLHDHASGWQFEVVPSPDGTHVWKAPDDTAYVVGRFRGPNGEITPDFPQAVMDNKKAAVKHDKITARLFTDTHRRCMATAACAQFGLAWQLWAKEEVEDPFRDDDSAPAAPVEKPQDVDDDDVPIPEGEKDTLLDMLDELSDEKLDQFCKAFDGKFVGQGSVSDRIQTEAHRQFINDWHSKQDLSNKDVNG